MYPNVPRVHLENKTTCPRDVPLELARRTRRSVIRTVSYRKNICARSSLRYSAALRRLHHDEAWSVPRTGFRHCILYCSELKCRSVLMNFCALRRLFLTPIDPHYIQPPPATSLPVFLLCGCATVTIPHRIMLPYNQDGSFRFPFSRCSRMYKMHHPRAQPGRPSIARGTPATFL